MAVFDVMEPTSQRSSSQRTAAALLLEIFQEDFITN
jgi:hypothetical protein